jgi:hypothetical protein
MANTEKSVIDQPTKRFASSILPDSTSLPSSLPVSLDSKVPITRVPSTIISYIMSHFLALRHGRRLGRTCKQFHLVSKSPQSGIIVMDDILIKRFNGCIGGYVDDHAREARHKWVIQLSHECHGRLTTFNGGDQAHLDGYECHYYYIVYYQLMVVNCVI